MSLRNKAIVVTGLIAGILAVRWVRNRSTQVANPRASPAEEVRKEALAAKEHATEATTHARAAGRKASEYAREEIRAVKP